MNLIALIVLVAVLLVAARFTERMRRAANGTEVSAAVRGAEALLLLLIGGTILLFAGFSPSTGGLMGMLDTLRPAYAAANATAFAVAALLAVFAAFLAWARSPGAATLLMGLVLAGYGAWTNLGSHPGLGLLPESWRAPAVTYIISNSGDTVRGAEVWVNGVLLGTSPVETTLETFVQKVPVWKAPPADFEDKIDVPVNTLRSASIRHYRRWDKFELPQAPKWGTVRSPADTQPVTPAQTYYIQFRYAGEWGAMSGSSGGGGSGGPFTYRAHTDIGVFFPGRGKRLEALLNQARLRDYRVEPAWFAALETYQEDGWNTLRLQGAEEPELLEVLRAWARHRYALEGVRTEEEAWNAFERVCEEADAAREYVPTSVAGEAVMLLAPQLPLERLLESARSLGDFNQYAYIRYGMNGRMYVGTTERHGGINLSGGGSTGSFGSGGRAGSEKRFPPRGFAIAHALQELWLRDVGRDRMRQALTPLLLLQYDRGIDLPLEIAAEMGGPIVDTFLLRQNWQATGKDIPWSDRQVMGSGEVNRWLRLLTLLNDQVGAEFRREHEREIFAIADTYVERLAFGWESRLDFLMRDTRLAQAYAPRFIAAVRAKDRNEALSQIWDYLRQSDAPPEDFIKAWEGTRIDVYSMDRALGVLQMVEEPRRRAIAAGVVAAIEWNPGQLENVGNGVEYAVRRLSAQLNDTSPQVKSRMESALDELRAPRTGMDPAARIRGWLTTAGMREPGLERLAEAPEPAIRRIAVAAAGAWPVADRRALLTQLAEDGDAEVRREARAVQASLEALRGRDPATLRSQGE